MKASRAQESTKFIPKKIKEIGESKVTEHNQNGKVYVTVILGNRACGQKRQYII